MTREQAVPLTPLQRKIAGIRADARYHEGGPNPGVTHDHGACLLLDACEAEREAVFAAQRERQDAVDRLRWAEAYKADRDGLAEAALALFDPMEHGGTSKPNPGHTPEVYCAACVRLRAQRTRAIQRVLVERGFLPSIGLRATPSDTPKEPTE